jgi:uncharacterized membrane protein required for colicin V production
MILTLIILVLVLAIAFFHYTQGLFSATLSAICTILAAVLAFSYHEVVVEALLGGRFAGAAHAMVLAVLFAVIYTVLRVLFDKMVPGNLRLPVLLDKVGAGVMGLVAGIFAGGIVAIIAQYLPLMPSVAGHARYVVDNRPVIVPGEATRGRAMDSETWDQLKSGKPGEFDESEKQAMLVPMDDLVVNTVGHLSDGGSLGWSRPLAAVHPDFLQELFAQRLGMQASASRVATPAAVTSADLFRLDSIERRDHEYKEMRAAPLDVTPLKPKQNEMLVVARVKLTKSATDKDGIVRFSPASVRLVGRKGDGANAQWVNYFPVGTVDAAKVLYASALDDFLFIKSTDGGVDLAFVVDKDGFTEGGTSKVAPGTFLEFKRMARIDLDKEIKPAKDYKPSPNVQVLRKKQATPDAATQAPTAVQAAPADALKEKLVGNWASTSDAGQLILDFKADGSLGYNNTPKGATPQIGQGSWAVVPEKSTADTLVITRTVGSTTAESTIKFIDDNTATLEREGTPTLQLTRR